MAKILTQEQAARAIYFDFEGCMDQAPSLLGFSYLSDDRSLEYFSQSILEPRLWPASGLTIPQTSGNCSTDHKTLADAVHVLVMIANNDDRLLVSWSTHDMKMIRNHLDDKDLATQAGARYRNALPTARQWLKKAHPEIELERGFGGRHSLAAYAHIMRQHIPEQYGPNVAAHGIRTMRAVFDSGRTYSTSTTTERDAWKALLGHNRLDCKIAREIIAKAAVEYAHLHSGYALGRRRA